MSKKVKEKCPLCNKPMSVSIELKAWESLDEVNKINDIIEEITGYVDKVIEIIHHNPKFERHAYRLAMFYTILDRIISYAMLSNAEKCGILELVKSHVTQHVSLQFALAEIEKEKIKNKMNRRDYLI